jgi:hypothetical protein
LLEPAVHVIVYDPAGTWHPPLLPPLLDPLLLAVPLLDPLLEAVPLLDPLELAVPLLEPLLLAVPLLDPPSVLPPLLELLLPDEDDEQAVEKDAIAAPDTTAIPKPT